MIDALRSPSPATPLDFQRTQFAEPLRGGKAEVNQRVDSLKQYDFFAFGTIQHDPKTHALLVIDTRPPSDVRKHGITRLAYYLPTGIPSAGYEQHPLPEAINKIREHIRLEMKTYGDSQGKIDRNKRKYYPDEWKKILGDGVGSAKSLLQHYEYTESAVRRQGWTGEFIANPSEHHLGRMRDFELGYTHALSDSGAERAWGAVLSRPKLYFKGMFQTLNRPREQGQKGGRTLWTSLPATLLVGNSVAVVAVLMSQKGVRPLAKTS